MTDQAINTSTIQISADNFQIDAYLAKPTSPGSYPGIVVLQEIFGVNVHIREVTERIAKPLRHCFNVKHLDLKLVILLRMWK